MASYTTNMNLKKPAGSENVAIGDINNNMDTIDQAFGTLNSKTGNQIGVIKVVESRAYGHTLYFPAYVGDYGISFNLVTGTENFLFYLYLNVVSNGTITKTLEKMSVNGAAGVDSNYCTVSMK